MVDRYRLIFGVPMSRLMVCRPELISYEELLVDETSELDKLELTHNEDMTFAGLDLGELGEWRDLSAAMHNAQKRWAILLKSGAIKIKGMSVPPFGRLKAFISRRLIAPS